MTNGIFHRTRTKSSAICRETQKTLNSQTILRRKTNWSNQAPRPQIISQSHSNQDSMAPAQKQKHRSMEQDSKIESPEINNTHGHPTTDKEARIYDKRKPPQQVVLENWTATRKSTPHTKINPKGTKDPNARSEMTKPPEKYTGKTLPNTNRSKILSDPPPNCCKHNSHS